MTPMSLRALPCQGTSTGINICLEMLKIFPRNTQNRFKNTLSIVIICEHHSVHAEVRGQLSRVTSHLPFCAGRVSLVSVALCTPGYSFLGI